MNLVITGTSAGIGRALAARLLQSGHRVWGLARSSQEDLVSAQGGNFRASRCDVADWAQVGAAATEIGAAWPAIDGLVCCAGWQGEIGRAVTADPLRWTETVRSNLDGAYYPIRAFHSGLQGGRRPKIVCFSGGGSTKPRPNFSAYGAAKTAIVRLVETIAAEEGGKLDINAVAPGAIATGMTEEILRLGPAVAGADEVESARKLLAGRGETLERALALVEWLLSAASDGVSGRLISALWDPWDNPGELRARLTSPKDDLYTLRRVT